MSIVYVKHPYPLIDGENDVVIANFGNSDAVDTSNPTAYDNYVIACDQTYLLNRIKASKEKTIRYEYGKEICDSVTVNSKAYHGGFESLNRIKTVYDLAVIASEADIKIYDVNNETQTLTLVNALAVLDGINVANQLLIDKKHSLLEDLSNATLSTIAAIEW